MYRDHLYTAQVISVEAFAGMEPSKILSRFPVLFSGIMESCAAALHGLGDTVLPAGPDKAFQSFLKANPYNKLMERRAYVPEGFKGTYLEYLTKIEKDIDTAVKVPKEVVAPFHRYVAELLSRPEKLSSVNPNQAPSISLMKEIYVEGAAVEHQARSHNPQVAGGEALYKDVIARNTDWKEIISRTESCVTKISDSGPAKLMEEVGEVGDLLNKLIEQIKNDPEAFHTSGVTLDSLSQTVLNVARAVEYYAAVVYLFGRFQVCVNGTRLELESSVSQAA
jgi:hypothetical protein